MMTMGFIDKLRAIFNASKHNTSSKLLEHVSWQLEELAAHLQERVEAAVSGQDGPAEANIDYVIKDRAGAELQSEWQDTDYVCYEDIIATTGFQALQKSAGRLAVTLKLEEENVEEVDDEERLRFIVQLSGWG